MSERERRRKRSRIVLEVVSNDGANNQRVSVRIDDLRIRQVDGLLGGGNHANISTPTVAPMAAYEDT